MATIEVTLVFDEKTGELKNVKDRNGQDAREDAQGPESPRSYKVGLGGLGNPDRHICPNPNEKCVVVGTKHYCVPK